MTVPLSSLVPLQGAHKGIAIAVILSNDLSKMTYRGHAPCQTDESAHCRSMGSRVDPLDILVS